MFDFHHHAPKKAAVLLAFHQQATNQVGGDELGRAAEEGLGERWGLLADGLGGYGSGLGGGAAYEGNIFGTLLFAPPKRTIVASSNCHDQ